MSNQPTNTPQAKGSVPAVGSTSTSAPVPTSISTTPPAAPVSGPPPDNPTPVSPAGPPPPEHWHDTDDDAASGVTATTVPVQRHTDTEVRAPASSRRSKSGRHSKPMTKLPKVPEDREVPGVIPEEDPKPFLSRPNMLYVFIALGVLLVGGIVGVIMYVHAHVDKRTSILQDRIAQMENDTRKTQEQSHLVSENVQKMNALLHRLVQQQQQQQQQRQQQQQAAPTESPEEEDAEEDATLHVDLNSEQEPAQAQHDDGTRQGSGPANTLGQASDVLDIDD